MSYAPRTALQFTIHRAVLEFTIHRAALEFTIHRVTGMVPLPSTLKNPIRVAAGRFSGWRSGA